MVLIVFSPCIELDFAPKEQQDDVPSDVVDDVPQVDMEKGMLTNIYPFNWFVTLT